MIDLFDLPVLGAAAFFASLVGSVAGSGSTAVLLPVMVLYFGIRDTILILTIANLTSNLGRAWFNRREIVLPVVGWFSLGAVPLALVGAKLFIVTPPIFLTRILGAFLLGTVAWRRLGSRSPKLHSPVMFLPFGAVFGLLAGILEGVGPLMAPFFLAYGLIRGAYIGTDALAAISMATSKLAVFGWENIIDHSILIAGLTLAPFMIGGAYAGKKIVSRLSERIFVILVDITLVVAGGGFLLTE